MRKYITFLILFISIGANAQFRASYSAGYGDYKMGDMKEMLKNAFAGTSSVLPEGVAIVDNFPGYVTHNVDLSYQMNNKELGVKFSYLTTGGKIAYSDYSGKYKEKITFSGYRVGIMYRFHFVNTHISDHKFTIFGELSPAITFTSLSYEGALDLYEANAHQQFEDNLSTNTTGYSIQPLVGATIELISNFSFYLSTGYDFEFKGKLSTTNDFYRADWTGFRMNAGVSYLF